MMWYPNAFLGDTALHNIYDNVMHNMNIKSIDHWFGFIINNA